MSDGGSVRRFWHAGELEHARQHQLTADAAGTTVQTSLSNIVYSNCMAELHCNFAFVCSLHEFQ